MNEINGEVTLKPIPPRRNGEKVSKNRGIERNILEKYYVQLLQRQNNWNKEAAFGEENQ